MNLLANMALAVVVGFALFFAVAAIILALPCAMEDSANFRARNVIRFTSGLAICGFIGALIMQSFGLWVT